MKPSYALFVAGGVLMLVDAFAGAKGGVSGGTLPDWYPSTLATIESGLPVSLGLLIVGAGAAAYYLGH
jgi:hypothetical protein